MTTVPPGVTLVKGDVTDATAVALAIAGAECVTTMFGHAAGSPSDTLAVGASNILAGMTAHNVRKLVFLGTSFAPDAKDKWGYFDTALFAILKTFILSVPARDAVIMKALLEARASVAGVEYVHVRPCVLDDTPASGSYTLGYFNEGMGSAIDKVSRADVAAALYDLTTNDALFNKWKNSSPALTRA